MTQAAFLALPHLEALYGGAAGGGKSDALLMAALQHVHVDGYNAILFRRTYKDLSMPEALMDRANQWLRETDVHWNGMEKRWEFPSGATLSFGYLDHEADKYRYQGAAFQFVGFDELTQFTESMYRYLFSRLRRLKGSTVPIRMRAASNPGGEGHEWVLARFIDSNRPAEHVFIPAKLEDNPHVDLEEYERSLAQLDPVTHQQLRNGNWLVRSAPGLLFKRGWFSFLDARPADIVQWVRKWDLASTSEQTARDPDWTVGVLLGRDAAGGFVVADVVRKREDPGGVEETMLATAELDRQSCGKKYLVHLSQDPGQAGKSQVAALVRLLKGFAAEVERESGDKVTRAQPVSAQAKAGNIRLVRGPWNEAFVQELEAFPQKGVHDDQVDALSGAFNYLAPTHPSERLRRALAAF